MTYLIREKINKITSTFIEQTLLVNKLLRDDYIESGGPIIEGVAQWYACSNGDYLNTIESQGGWIIRRFYGDWFGLEYREGKIPHFYEDPVLIKVAIILLKEDGTY